MLKAIYAGIAAAFILAAGYSYSQAAPTAGDTPFVCPAAQVWATVKPQLEDKGRVTQLNKELSENFHKAMGTKPPHARTDIYDLYLAEQGEIGAIFVVEDGCTIDRAGPGPLEVLKNMLGIGNA